MDNAKQTAVDDSSKPQIPKRRRKPQVMPFFNQIGKSFHEQPTDVVWDDAAKAEFDSIMEDSRVNLQMSRDAKPPEIQRALAIIRADRVVQAELLEISKYNGLAKIMYFCHCTREHIATREAGTGIPYDHIFREEKFGIVANEILTLIRRVAPEVKSLNPLTNNGLHVIGCHW